MNRLALLFVTFMIAGAIPMTVGCASRQKKSDVPAQAAAIDHRPAASATPAAVDPPAAADPPAADPATIASAAGQGSGDAPADQPEIMGAPSADELSDADIVAAQKPSGSIIDKAIRATPQLAKDVVLSPFRFVWKVLKKSYTAEGLAKSQTMQINGKTVAIADYTAEMNKSKKQKSLSEKAMGATATGYNYAEKTVFLPFQFLDSAVGAIFMPF